MSEPRWLSTISLVLLHLEAIAEYGGGGGLREEGLLESALARPRNLFVYQGIADLARLAAAYCYGIARNHPFVDGNKRVAFLAIGLFLGKNGQSLEADRVDATNTLFRVAAGEMSEEQLTAWIREHVVKREPEA